MKKPTILGKDPDDRTFPWSEAQIQAFIVQEARRRDLVLAGDMNQGQRSRGQAGLAKATGLTSGEPDLRFYMAGGRLVLIELKTTSGKLSPAQKNHHERLASMGFMVHTVFAATPWQGWVLVCECLGISPTA